MSTFDLVFKLTFYIFLGFVAVKIKTVSKDFYKQLSSFVMLIPMPALTIRAFYSTELSSDTLSNFGMSALCAVTMLATLCVVGIITKKFHKRPSEAHICVYALMTSNFNFFGIPVVEALFGHEGIFYYTVITGIARIVYYGAPPYLLGDNQHADAKGLLRQMLCPPIIAVIIGLIMFFAQIRPPEQLDGIVHNLANIASPLGMMLCGMALANAKLDDVFGHPSVILMCVVHLLISPAVIMGVCLLFGFAPLITKLVMIYAMCPFGALMPAFAAKYCSDEHSAIHCSILVSVSTVLCLVTLPFWIYILNSSIIG